jgi:hypothetical protein
MSKTIRQLWRDEFRQGGVCILCKGAGWVDVTRKTESGCEFGSREPCICPDGRALKTSFNLAARPAPAKEP